MSAFHHGVVVLLGGVEPPWPFDRHVLSVMRIPIPPQELVLLVHPEGFEPSRPLGQQPLRLPCLPFHHECLVRGNGLEPSRSFDHWDLGPARLPITPTPQKNAALGLPSGTHRLRERLRLSYEADSDSAKPMASAVDGVAVV